MEEKLSKRQLLKLKAKESSLKFRRELRKSITTALAAAFGFLIALSWRDAVNNIMSKILNMTSVKNEILGALIITILSVLGILVVSKFSYEEQKTENETKK